MSRRSRRLGALLACLFLLPGLGLAACGDEEQSGPAAPAGQDFAAIEAAAQGQTVRIWMYSGNQNINRFIDGDLTRAVQKRGVKIRRVPIDDAEAVDRVSGEKRAGKDSGGGVDLYWSNGRLFAKGKNLKLWERDWATDLPNYRRYVPAASKLITDDFGVAVDGQESPWLSAAFQYAYDSAKVEDPPADFDELLAYARENPGRVAYPAPPDFTGNAFVTQVVRHFGDDADQAFAYLAELKPLTYKEGRTYPESEAELAELFSNDQVDFGMAYDPNYTSNGVRTGQFPKTARPFLLDGRALVNYSFMSLPFNAKNAEGAKVVADTLLSPEIQARIADPKVLGNPPVIDLARVTPEQRRRFEFPADDRYRLKSFGAAPWTEYASARNMEFEQRWKREILR